MSKKSTKLKDMINEHYILGELPSSKLKKMKWNPVTGETMNEDDTNEYGSPSMGSMSSSDEKAPRMKTSKETENIKIAVIATQKSGALAAVKETTLEILSKIPFGLYAAKEPINIAPTRAIDIATAAKDKVTGIASNTMSIAGLSFLSE